MSDDPGREERVHLIVEIRRSLFHVFCAINPTPRQQRQFLEDAIIDALAQAIKSEADPRAVRRALSVLLGITPPIQAVPEAPPHEDDADDDPDPRPACSWPPPRPSDDDLGGA